VRADQIEIGEFRSAMFVEQDVCWFDVAVDHSPVMSQGKRITDLKDER